MIGNFYDAFGKGKDTGRDIPEEILELLNQQLPDNLLYARTQDGTYEAIPNPEKIFNEIRFTTQFDLDEEKDAVLIERLNRIPRNEWSEYLYRRQKAIRIKNMKIGDEKKVVPIEKTLGNPLSDSDSTITHAFMYPARFPAPIPMRFETREGKETCIHFQQQAYDSLTEIQFSNVDCPALRLEVYHFRPLGDNLPCEDSVTNAANPSRIKYFATPSKAASVREAITALRICKGICDGTVRMNGRKLSRPNEESQIASDQLDEILAFWLTALHLENALGVSFDPGAEFPEEDAKFFAELESCFIKKEAIVWNHPFDHFHLGGFRLTNGNRTIEDFIGKDAIRYEFTEGPIPATLLGAEFHLYSRTKMTNFVMTNIDWDDETRSSGKVYITDAPGKVWTLSRLYMPQSEFEAEKQQS